MPNSMISWEMYWEVSEELYNWLLIHRWESGQYFQNDWDEDNNNDYDDIWWHADIVNQINMTVWVCW